ncbi:MAG TPA: hypothetical protein VKB18_01610 [Gemmatimonadota bacterium]|nr:hypothetical protein [Gemmatimonadota bacterium]
MKIEARSPSAAADRGESRRPDRWLRWAVPAGATALACVLAVGCEPGASPSGPAAGGPAAAAVSSSAGPFQFVQFELGAEPGTTCPSGPGCTNRAAEPAIRADGAGNFYVTSELGLSAGTLAWKSADGGLHYTALTSPNQLSTSSEDLAPGGGDTDLATAPEPNADGVHNVYVASLSLADVTVSASVDGGATWSRNVTSATIPGDDREWIAADGASKVCISYHDVVTFNIEVSCSFDAGASFTQVGTAIDAEHAWLIDDNAIGNLAIDPSDHTVYQSLSGIGSAAEAVVAGPAFHAVWIAVSHDGGQTFTDYAVHIDEDTSRDFGHQFVNVTVDRAGTVYVVYSDDHHLYYSFSGDHGRTWTGPLRIDQSPSETSIMPWSVACDPGQLDVVWYGTPFYADTLSPDTYPASAAWRVYFAQNRKADEAGTRFSQGAATPVVHYGGVCESGVTCTGNRDLYDDFGVAVDPTTGRASIAYSDDQPGNTGSDDHTAVATQTAGSGICPGS